MYRQLYRLCRRGCHMRRRVKVMSFVTYQFLPSPEKAIFVTDAA